MKGQRTWFYFDLADGYVKANFKLPLLPRAATEFLASNNALKPAIATIFVGLMIMTFFSILSSVLYFTSWLFGPSETSSTTNQSTVVPVPETQQDMVHGQEQNTSTHQTTDSTINVRLESPVHISLPNKRPVNLNFVVGDLKLHGLDCCSRCSYWGGDRQPSTLITAETVDNLE